MRLFFILLLFPLVAIAQVMPDSLDISANSSEQSVEQDSSDNDIPLTDTSERQIQTPPNQSEDYKDPEEISEDDPLQFPYDM